MPPGTPVPPSSPITVPYGRPVPETNCELTWNPAAVSTEVAADWLMPSTSGRPPELFPRWKAGSGSGRATGP